MVGVSTFARICLVQLGNGSKLLADLFIRSIRSYNHVFDSTLLRIRMYTKPKQHAAGAGQRGVEPVLSDFSDRRLVNWEHEPG